MTDGLIGLRLLTIGANGDADRCRDHHNKRTDRAHGSNAGRNSHIRVHNSRSRARTRRAHPLSARRQQARTPAQVQFHAPVPAPSPRWQRLCLRLPKLPMLVSFANPLCIERSVSKLNCSRYRLLAPQTDDTGDNADYGVWLQASRFQTWPQSALVLLRPAPIADGSHQPIGLDQHTNRTHLRAKREADHNECRTEE